MKLPFLFGLIIVITNGMIFPQVKASEIVILSDPEFDLYVREQGNNYMVTQYCDLIQNPKKYDGKNVAVRAAYRYGIEWQELFGMKCLGQGKTWLEFASKNNENTHRTLRKAPRDQGTFNATFYGKFNSADGPHGDGSYVFKFEVESVKDIKIVSKNGWEPNRLSEKERKKIYQGNEEVHHNRK